MEQDQSETRPITTGATAVKADITKRAIAAVIDGVVAGVVSIIPFVGAFIGGLYILLRDGLDVDYLKGRSLGKTLMKLRVVRDNGEPMDINTSIRRNWTLSLGLIVSILALIPILGWIAGIFVGLLSGVLVLFEAVMVFMDAEGRRFGDRTAGTKIVESVD